MVPKRELQLQRVLFIDSLPSGFDTKFLLKPGNQVIFDEQLDFVLGVFHLAIARLS